MKLRPERTQMVAFGQQVGKWNDSPPKNSLAIVDKAVLKNFDVIELDTRISLDEIAVLGHDDLLKGPDGEIVISRSNVRDLQNFSIGEYEGVPQYVVTLSKALMQAGDKRVLIDPRIKPGEYSIIRNSVDTAEYDPEKLLFCVYNPQQAKALTEKFPESTHLYKLKTKFTEVSEKALDEAVSLGMDGVMLFRPIYDEDFSALMSMLKDRGLQVLFYVHGGWPKPHKPDIVSKSLQNMIDSGVEYVTTICYDLPEFKKLVR